VGKAKTKQKEKGKSKLCWNCEGRVPIEIEQCPYCGVSVQPLMVPGADLLAPPYARAQAEEAIPDAPYQTDESQEADGDSQESTEKRTSPWRLREARRFILPLIALQTGVVFSFFSIALLLFSQKGVLTLQWRGDIWYLYLLVALPLLIVGFISLLHWSEDSTLSSNSR